MVNNEDRLLFVLRNMFTNFIQMKYFNFHLIRFGGWYADIDTVSLKPLEDLGEGVFLSSDQKIKSEREKVRHHFKYDIDSLIL